MTFYIHEPTLTYPVKEIQIKATILAEQPNTSFAKPFVPPEEYVKVEPSEQPAFDAIYQTITETAPVQVDGIWVQTWSVRDATREEVLSRIPNVVSMRQGMLATLYTPYEDGVLLDVIEAMLNAIADPMEQRAAKTDWEYATEIRRDFPLVQQLTAQLGMTEKQIDDLFILASTL